MIDNSPGAINFCVNFRKSCANPNTKVRIEHSHKKSIYFVYNFINIYTKLNKQNVFSARNRNDIAPVKHENK